MTATTPLYILATCVLKAPMISGFPQLPTRHPPWDCLTHQGTLPLPQRTAAQTPGGDPRPSLSLRSHSPTASGQVRRLGRFTPVSCHRSPPWLSPPQHVHSEHPPTTGFLQRNVDQDASCNDARARRWGHDGNVAVTDESNRTNGMMFDRQCGASAAACPPAPRPPPRPRPPTGGTPDRGSVSQPPLPFPCPPTTGPPLPPPLRCNNQAFAECEDVVHSAAHKLPPPSPH